MPLIEVDSEVAQRHQAAFNLLDKIASDSELRTPLLKMVKKLNPKAPIPELDAAQPLNDAFSAFSAKFDKELSGLKDERASEKAQREVEGRIEKERSALRKQGWDDEGIEQVEKCMLEEGITSYKAAAALVERDMKKGQGQGSPTAPHYKETGWDIHLPSNETEDYDLLMEQGSQDSWGRKQVAKILNERR